MKGGSTETNPTQVQVKIFPNKNYVDGILDKDDKPEYKVHTITTIEGNTYKYCLKDPTGEYYYQPEIVDVEIMSSGDVVKGILHPGDNPMETFHNIILEGSKVITNCVKRDRSTYYQPQYPHHLWDDEDTYW